MRYSKADDRGVSLNLLRIQLKQKIEQAIITTLKATS